MDFLSRPILGQIAFATLVLHGVLGGAAAHAQTPGPLAYWKLDGNTKDTAGRCDAMAVDVDAGAIRYAKGFDGKENGAADFSKTDDYLTTEFWTRKGPRSLSLFFTTTTDQGGIQVFAGEAGPDRFFAGAHVTGPGTLSGGVGDGGPQTARAPEPPSMSGRADRVKPDGSWYHMVLTDDGAGNVRMYFRPRTAAAHVTADYQVTIPGKKEATFSIGALALGRSPASGLVDDVAVFDRVVTPEEVDAIFESGSVEATLKQQPQSPTPSDQP